MFLNSSKKGSKVHESNCVEQNRTQSRTFRNTSRHRHAMSRPDARTSAAMLLLCVLTWSVSVAAIRTPLRAPGRGPNGKVVQHHPIGPIPMREDGTPRPTSLNCSWRYMTQPLDHFNEVRMPWSHFLVSNIACVASLMPSLHQSCPRMSFTLAHPLHRLLNLH